jgi:hypothetical protein
MTNLMTTTHPADPGPIRSVAPLHLLRRQDRRVAGELPRPKVWRYPKVVSEHAFDKLLQLLDCTFGELRHAEVIGRPAPRRRGLVKGTHSSVGWRRHLHWSLRSAAAERIVTVYGTYLHFFQPGNRRTAANKHVAAAETSATWVAVTSLVRMIVTATDPRRAANTSTASTVTQIRHH